MPESINTIYRYEWKGVKTGWDYRLEFIPPYDELLPENSEYIYLPTGCIDVEKLSFRYDKYPLGLGEAKALELKIYLKQIMDEPNLQQFFALLLNPIQQRLTLIGNIIFGIVIKLWIKFNKNAEPDVNNYKEVFVGVIRYDLISNLDLMEFELDITALDLRKVVLSSIKLSHIGAFLRSPEVEKKTASIFPLVVEYMIDTVSRKELVTNVTARGQEYFYIKFVKFSDFQRITKQLYNYVLGQFLRVDWETLDYDLHIPLPVVYRQKYDGSGYLEQELNNNEIYIMLSNEDGYSIGAFSMTYDKSLIKLYNTLWDFLIDMYEACLRRAVDYGNVLNVNSYGIFDYNYEINIDSSIFNKLSAKINCDKITSATISIPETRGGDGFSDLDNFKILTLGGLSELEYGVALPFNNMPPAIKYYISQFQIHPLLNRQGRLGSAKALNLYYFDSIAGVDLPIRVHEYCKFKYAPAKYTDSLAGGNFSPHVWNNVPKDQPSENITILQQNTHWGKWLANALIQLLGGKLTKLEVSVDIDQATYFAGGGSQGWVWLRQDLCLYINFPEEYNSLQLPNKYLVLFCEIDFKEEVANVELIGAIE